MRSYPGTFFLNVPAERKSAKLAPLFLAVYQRRKQLVVIVQHLNSDVQNGVAHRLCTRVNYDQKIVVGILRAVTACLRTKQNDLFDMIAEP